MERRHRCGTPSEGLGLRYLHLREASACIQTGLTLVNPRRVKAALWRSWHVDDRYIYMDIPRPVVDTCVVCVRTRACLFDAGLHDVNDRWKPGKK